MSLIYWTSTSGFAPRSNFLVAIHSTLSRLEEAGEIQKSTITGKWVAVHPLHGKQGLALVSPPSASQTENLQQTPVSSIPSRSGAR